MKKCYGCAYYEPSQFRCYKYLRGIETAIYLSSYCMEKEMEMQEVEKRELAYAEVLND